MLVELEKLLELSERFVDIFLFLLDDCILKLGKTFTVELSRLMITIEEKPAFEIYRPFLISSL